MQVGVDEQEPFHYDIYHNTIYRQSTYINMNDQKHVSENLPLTETVFLILLSMVKGPIHGYAIMKDVHRLSYERIDLSTGTLYGALKRMRTQGWIEPAELSGKQVRGRERKGYRMTALGQNIFKADLKRLQGLIQAVRMRVSGEM